MQDLAPLIHKHWLLLDIFMDTSIVTAFIGAGSALLGSVVGGVVTYTIQSKLLNTASKRNEASKLIERRLNALQNMVVAIDVVLGNEGTTEGGEISKLMNSVIHELPKHIPFLPTNLRDDALSLLHQFFAGAKTGEMKVELPVMIELKIKALDAIDESYANSQS